MNKHILESEKKIYKEFRHIHRLVYQRFKTLSYAEKATLVDRLITTYNFFTKKI